MGERYLDNIFTNEEIKKEITQKFSNTPELFLDGYHPMQDTDRSRACILWCHGGGGTRQDMDGKCMTFSKKGYVCMTIDYRGGGGNFNNDKQKLAASDLWAAIRWVRKNATRLGVNPDWIFSGGVSAGALTALNANVSANNEQDPFFQDDPELNRSTPGFAINVLGSTTTSGACQGPFFDFIDSGDSPNFFYNGELDETISFKQAVKTYDKMIEVGIASTMMSFPDSGHQLGSHTAEINADVTVKFFNLLGV